MERLIKRTAVGTANIDYPKSVYFEDGTKDAIAVSAYRQKIIDRLAAYEDIGLEPEEIERIVDAYGRGHTLRSESAERLEIIRTIKTDRLRELVQAEQDGRLKIVNKPPKGECCGNCVDFLRETGTARGTCRTQYKKRNIHRELRCVSQSTKACAAFNPREEAEAELKGGEEG